ncbi:hypothetical protein M5689_020259 [Euphorbia peplus]|nr:hypothetical protein M5689_020259 [Euphorbia peplus]
MKLSSQNLVSPNQDTRFRRGDIVWARLEFPNKWWPALFQSISGHRIAVSFFTDGQDPHLFQEPDVVSFEENFESLSNTLQNWSRGEELLNSALKLLARRAAYTLRCHCHFRLPGLEKRRGDAFLGEALLSFVRGLAVSAFVRDSDFVRTVTMASQVHVFRGFLVADRKGFSDLKPMADRIQNSTLPLTGACSVAQPSEVSKLDFESFNTDIPALPKPYLSNPTQSLGLKRHNDHSDESDICFKLCKTLPLSSINRIHADTKTSEIGRTVCGLETSIHMDHGRDNHNIPVEHDRQDDFNAAFSSMKKLLLPRLTSDAWSSIPLEAQQSENSIQMNHSRRNHSISVEDGRQDGINEDLSSKESSVETLLLPPVTTDAPAYVLQEAPQLENAIQMDHSCNNHNISFENGRQDGINSDASSSTPQKAPESETALQMDHSQDNYNISFKKVRKDGINEAFISRKSSMRKCLLPLVTSDAPSSIPQEAMPSENAIQTGRSRHNHNMYVDTSRLESSTKKKPTVNKQSSRAMYKSCQFLYMKFPKDFSLPSKKDLLRKFRGFGQMDLFRTKVFERLGSAQVVFSYCLDVLAAYQYAKKKKSLFGGATVLFWLDPHEKKRNQSKFVVAPMPKLKSCLKNLSSGGQEDKKRSKKVRFLMQSQTEYN